MNEIYFITAPSSRQRILKQPAKVPRTRWGSWQLDQRAQTLDFEPEDRRLGRGWFIQLDQLRSTGGVRDALTYSMKKQYFDKEDVANFALALHDLKAGQQA